MCNCDIVDYAEQNDSPKDQHAIVHGHRSSGRCWWPKTEEDDDDHENACYDIYGDAKESWDSERPPLQSCVCD